METEICAGAIIYRIVKEKPLFLLIKSSATGWWVFPKGHVKGKETIIETATREVLEETSIENLKHIKDFYETISFINSKGNKKQVHHFLFETINEIVQISDEHIGFKWLEFSQAYELVNHESQKRILKVAQEVIQNARD